MEPASASTALRVRALNELDPTDRDGPVCYWSTMARRMRENHGLDHAVRLANELDRGLVVIEALRADYPYACRRFHRFVMDGMRDNANACAAASIPYLGHVEPTPRGTLLKDAATWTCAIVTDDHPGFFFPRMLEAVAKLPVPVIAVDSNGLVPLAATPDAFTTAYSFRRWLHKHLPDHLLEAPAASPLDGAMAGTIPPDFADRYASNHDGDLDEFGVGAPDEVDLPGGQEAAAERWHDFLDDGLPRYDESNHPDAHATSEMSPYLHFGHISSHRMVLDILEREDWEPSRLGEGKGQRAGWWGLSEPAEAFLDQIITWRELGFVELYHHLEPFDPRDTFASLPDFARKTLDEHRADERIDVAFAELEAGRSPDPVWNAAQRQLLNEGVIHNYFRMVWGKRLLEWAPDPETALEWMFTLNDKYALDGRDPNSISGIMWCLGRYDRGWGERAIFGKVRYMSSENTLRKLKAKGYMAKHGIADDAAAQKGG